MTEAQFLPSGTSMSEEASNERNASSGNVAARELRSLELFYLTLTVLSPFFGASLLKFIAITISGDPTTLSWFSTTLFVLATGIRPWTHLVERLRDRSEALKGVVEDANEADALPNGFETCESPADEQILETDVEKETKMLRQEVESLRSHHSALERRLAEFENTHTQEWDDMADSVVAVESEGRKFRRECVQRVEAAERRVVALEETVSAMQTRQGEAVDDKGQQHERNNGRTWTAIRKLLLLPWSVTVLSWRVSLSIALWPIRIVRGLSMPSPPAKERSLPAPAFAPILSPLHTIYEEPEPMSALSQSQVVSPSSAIQNQGHDQVAAEPLLPSQDSEETIVGTASSDKVRNSTQAYTFSATLNFPFSLYYLFNPGDAVKGLGRFPRKLARGLA